MAADSQKQTSLHCFYHWAEQTPDSIYLTQPYPDGQVEDITWAQAADQVSGWQGIWPVWICRRGVT